MRNATRCNYVVVAACRHRQQLGYTHNVAQKSFTAFSRDTHLARASEKMRKLLFSARGCTKNTLLIAGVSYDFLRDRYYRLTR